MRTGAGVGETSGGGGRQAGMGSPGFGGLMAPPSPGERQMEAE